VGPDAYQVALKKTDLACAVAAIGRHPMTVVASAVGVSSSNLHARLAREAKPQRHTQRPDRSHDGKVVTLRSNLRWRSDGLEFTCWNGDVIRAALIEGAHDREIIAWRAGISGPDAADMMLEAVETRFGGYRAPQPVEIPSNNGSPYIANETRIFAGQLGLKPCFTLSKSPQSNGISEAFVNTLKRDYVRVTPLPNAATVLGLIGGWINAYNENHPHSGLTMRSPREFIAAKTATAWVSGETGARSPSSFWPGFSVVLGTLRAVS
jgi:transposase InsO family protein